MPTYEDYVIIAITPLQEGVTPLSMACQTGHTSVVKLLLKAKATTDVQNKVSFATVIWYPSCATLQQ